VDEKCAFKRREERGKKEKVATSLRAGGAPSAKEKKEKGEGNNANAGWNVLDADISQGVEKESHGSY